MRLRERVSEEGKRGFGRGEVVGLGHEDTEIEIKVDFRDASFIQDGLATAGFRGCDWLRYDQDLWSNKLVGHQPRFSYDFCKSVSTRLIFKVNRKVP